MQTEQIDYDGRFQDAIFCHLVEQGIEELTDSNEDFSPKTLNSLGVYRQPSIALPTPKFSSPSSEHTLEGNP